MDRDEMNAILDAESAALRGRGYAGLCRLVEPENAEIRLVPGRLGNCYNLEIFALWDDEERGLLRVRVNIDDGRWRNIFLPCRDFVIAPDGTVTPG